MRIEPTLGRIVWFFPAIDGGRHEDGQPFSAQIAGVNDDGTINLGVFARDGSPYGVQNVPLKQDGDSIDQDTPHAVWMPYQKGQAAKTEAVQQSAAVDVDARITELVDTRIQQMGEWTVKTLQDFDARLTALTTPPAAPPAASDAPVANAGDSGTASTDAPQPAPQPAT